MTRPTITDADRIALAGIGVPDSPDAWAAIGCTVADGAVSLANGSLLLGRSGIMVAEAVEATDVEGIPLSSGPVLDPVIHDSGATELDHLVLLTDSLERTSTAVAAALGLACLRIRETGAVRQAFHRFADAHGRRGCIIEIVESTQVEETTLMGVVLIVPDLFDLADRLGTEVMSAPKPAVQRGRYISTVRRGVGLGTAVAIMTPDV